MLIGSLIFSSDLKIASDAHIDFTPLHQCLHIHNVLGKRNLLKLVYDENRRFQADSLLKKAFNFTGNDLGPFEMYLENMAGFFIVEAIVMESTTDLRSRNHVSIKMLSLKRFDLTIAYRLKLFGTLLR